LEEGLQQNISLRVLGGSSAREATQVIRERIKDRGGNADRYPGGPDVFYVSLLVGEAGDIARRRGLQDAVRFVNTGDVKSWSSCLQLLFAAPARRRGNDAAVRVFAAALWRGILGFRTPLFQDIDLCAMTCGASDFDRAVSAQVASE
jgi:hypothetical protein